MSKKFTYVYLSLAVILASNNAEAISCTASLRRAFNYIKGGAFPARSSSSLKEAFSALSQMNKSGKRSLIAQNEEGVAPTDSGGACGPVCVVNGTQGLLQSKNYSLMNPIAAIADLYIKYPSL